MMIILLKLLGGMAGLAIGGELLVRGASQLAAAARLSPLFIGLTVVAIGTSSPELIVSISTSMKGQGDLSLGNVVGSNLFNTLAILGIAAMASPLIVKRQMIRFDVPFMIFASLLMPALAIDGRIGPFEGGILLVTLLVYTIWAYLNGRKETKTSEMVAHELDVKPKPVTFALIMTQLGIIVGGLILLVVGCDWFVGASVDLARQFGLSEVVIGLTILAAGTSLPELVTSVVATIRNERDIAVGNVIGSNMFNILGVLGAAAIFSGDGLQIAPTMFTRDLPAMVGSAIICLPIFLTYGVITRWEGLLLFSLFVLYNTYLVLDATGNPAAASLGWFALYIAIPATFLFLTATVIHSATKKKLVA